ncbi:hypothetical protein ARMA_0999 [Ardenticatena maritima]|uniref:Alcohol dehydrogenase n=1 Tax=Ardenticatena maritima TaxID=872965 RepID=A0A0M8K8Q8_9CHLR|nr:alcohol dehydrogenase catalytic domain-containing protein [Ardenticatena maritima]KPL89523.1 alcohol dehydrogenase [Ardenticatena maritima]GAP62576.1 hypothetical protein ARMA_0999 [Ardenticatena maritima]
MKAIFLENGTVSVRDMPMPERPPHHALLRMRLAGICDTDLQLQRGYYGFEGVPGHEFVAEVVEAPDEALIGARVVGEINLGCGACDWCRRGMQRHCPNRTVLGIVNHPGAHAEYLTLPVENLHRVPDSMPDDVAVFTEPVAAACEILEQVHVAPTWNIAIVGDGKLGLLIAQVLRLTGANVHLLGHHAHKLALLEGTGVQTHLVHEGEDLPLPRHWADMVVEVTGNPSGFATARALVRPRGVFVLKSTFKERLDLWLADIVVDEITIVGSRCGPFDTALRLLGEGLVNVRPLIEATYPLDAGVRAYEHAATRGARKILLRPSG